MVADLTSSSANRLIVLRSKLERLNTPVSEATLGGATPNKDRLLPVLLGECHNVEPLLVGPRITSTSSTTELWSASIEGAGQRRAVVQHHSHAGRWQVPAGQYAGRHDYGQCPGPHALRQHGRGAGAGAGYYGTPTERLTAGDLDAASLAAAAAHPQPVGSWLPTVPMCCRCCQQLAASVGAQVVMARQGREAGEGRATRHRHARGSSVPPTTRRIAVDQAAHGGHCRRQVGLLQKLDCADQP